jgi:hypothetical protein
MSTRSLAAVLTIGLVHAGPAWSGEIRETVSKFPSNLATPLGPQSNTVQKFTGIGCYDARTGLLQDCGFDMTVVGLTPPPNDDNGGHNHNPDTHPTGDLSIVDPVVAGPSKSLLGLQTAFDIFVVSHKIPDVSGKVDTLLNLRVPPGWHTVSPESCDGSETSWCFRTTIAIRVPDLVSLPDISPFYEKHRNGAPNHQDADAYSGTADAIFNLIEIAEEYSNMTTLPLSINDMSLPKGGLFDIKSNYVSPHTWHRTGQSADINKPAGIDCRNDYELIVAVNFVMPADSRSFYTKRGFSRSGRFLCEPGPDFNIHIDLDVIPPPPPSPFQ